MANNDYEVIHAADHIREFVSDNFRGNITRMSQLIGIDRKSMQSFAGGRSSANIDRVEAFLNVGGYTLVPIKISEAQRREET